MKVYLRPLELDDYIFINKWRNDSNITKFLGGNVHLVSSEREKKSIENKIFDDSKNIYFAICDLKTHDFIGYSSINNIDLRNRKAEWGGTLIGDNRYIGKNYGKDASKLTLRFLFNHYPIHKCYGYCLEEHPSSNKLFISLGFTKEGILRDEVFKYGEFKNIVLYSIIRNEINEQF